MVKKRFTLAEKGRQIRRVFVRDPESLKLSLYGGRDRLLVTWSDLSVAGPDQPRNAGHLPPSWYRVRSTHLLFTYYQGRGSGQAGIVTLLVVVVLQTLIPTHTHTLSPLGFRKFRRLFVYQ